MTARVVTIALQSVLVLAGCVLVAIGATWAGVAAIALGIWGLAETWD